MNGKGCFLQQIHSFFGGVEMRKLTRRSSMVGALSAEEFRQGAEQHPNMARKSLNIAQAVLVKGEQIADVATRTGLDRRVIHFWVKQIYDASIPTGWVSQVITLPREKMDRVLEMQAQERSKWTAPHQAS
jgi:hypothetical protein